MPGMAASSVSGESCRSCPVNMPVGPGLMTWTPITYLCLGPVTWPGYKFKFGIDPDSDLLIL